MENRAIIKFHIAFWVLVVIVTLPESFLYTGHPLFIPQFTGTFSVLAYNFVIFYIFYSYLTEKFFVNKKYIRFAFFSFSVVTITGFAVTFFSYYLFIFTYPETLPIKYTHKEWVLSFIYGVMGIGTLYSILGLLSKIALLWYTNKLNQADTEKQNLSTELAMLRAQVNPHFLFNTLNNIKSLTKSLPSKAVNSIDKLSSIMNYMLYDSSMDTVFFEKEITYIQDYIELEKIRYSDPGYIDFSINGNYSEIRIPPLIFMPFIENAFKHGNKLVAPPGIKIKFDINGRNVDFFVTNSMKENYDTVSKNSGFGLKNIKRRLELLFGDNYSLIINEEKKEFKVKLKLFLL